MMRIKGYRKKSEPTYDVNFSLDCEILCRVNYKKLNADLVLVMMKSIEAYDGLSQKTTY